MKNSKTSMARKATGKLKRRRGPKAHAKAGGAPRAKAAAKKKRAGKKRAGKKRAEKKRAGKKRAERKRAGKKRGPKPGANLRFNWAGVDWGQRDAEIARRLGVSRERVRQVRKGKGLPPSSELGGRPAGKTDGEMSRRPGVTPRRVGRARRPIDPSRLPVVLRAYGWDEAKWR